MLLIAKRVAALQNNSGLIGLLLGLQRPIYGPLRHSKFFSFVTNVMTPPSKCETSSSSNGEPNAKATCPPTVCSHFMPARF